MLSSMDMPEPPRRPDGFMARLIGPDKVVSDCKFFHSLRGHRARHRQGLEAVEGDVARAEVWSPDHRLAGAVDSRTAALVVWHQKVGSSPKARSASPT
jgi:hypothetical protein